MVRITVDDTELLGSSPSIVPRVLLVIPPASSLRHAPRRREREPRPGAHMVTNRVTNSPASASCLRLQKPTTAAAAPALKSRAIHSKEQRERTRKPESNREREREQAKKAPCPTTTSTSGWSSASRSGAASPASSPAARSAGGPSRRTARAGSRSRDGGGGGCASPGSAA